MRSLKLNCAWSCSDYKQGCFQASRYCFSENVYLVLSKWYDSLWYFFLRLLHYHFLLLNRRLIWNRLNLVFFCSLKFSFYLFNFFQKMINYFNLESPLSYVSHIWGKNDLIKTIKKTIIPNYELIHRLKLSDMSASVSTSITCCK